MNTHKQFWWKWGLLICSVLAINDEVLVQIQNGTIRGMVSENRHGNLVDRFYGIPYAKPPVKNYRFRKPEPLGKNDVWSGELDTTRRPGMHEFFTERQCYISLFSKHSFDNTFLSGISSAIPWSRGQEDCLYLDIVRPHVETPDTQTPENLKSVMIWLPGGGFTFGTGTGFPVNYSNETHSIFEAHHLAGRGDVIIVSVTYRVGTLGFLSIPGSSEITGNQGIYDQELAIQWVYENIENFGGNKHDITIFGLSAGSLSVGFQVQNPRLVLPDGENIV